MNEKTTRKKTRLDGYEYSQEGAYFVAVCSKDRAELFGEIKDGKITLSDIGRVIECEINKVQSIRKECSVDVYAIMPNHVHLIVKITNVVVRDYGNRPVDIRKTHDARRADCHPPLQRSLSNMMQGVKGAVTRIIGFSPWQRSYHDHIIRNHREYIKIAEYIKNNPAQWTEDMYYIEQQTM
jgi:REP element-mobilizing transposase RayT